MWVPALMISMVCHWQSCWPGFPNPVANGEALVQVWGRLGHSLPSVSFKSTPHNSSILQTPWLSIFAGSRFTCHLHVHLSSLSLSHPSHHVLFDILSSSTSTPVTFVDDYLWVDFLSLPAFVSPVYGDKYVPGNTDDALLTEAWSMYLLHISFIFYRWHLG